MFRVVATSIEEYFRFDQARETDLRKVDATLSAAAPSLTRWFVPGAKGSVGMRMIMIGYGRFFYQTKSSPERVKWPVVGLALQKNYLSLYCSVYKGGRSFVADYAASLGKVKVSQKGVINFVEADDLDCDSLHVMIHDLQTGLKMGRLNTQYGRVADQHD